MLLGTMVFAKTEDPTSVAQPVSAYGTYNGVILPLKVASDGSVVTSGGGGGGTPGGSNPQLQYNNAGSFGGVSGSGVTSGGNVGIGSVNPTSKLDVTGTIKASTDVQVGGTSVCLSNGSNCPAGGTNPWLTLGGTGNVGIYTVSSVGIGTSLGASGTQLSIVNGNVGIGTWKPTANLSVGQVTANSFQVSATGQVNLGSTASNGTANIHDREINAFDTVYNFNGVATYTDNSSESKTTFGTAFSVINTNAYYLYLGKSTTFRDVSVSLSVFATAADVLIPEYWNGAAWVSLTATDNTNNFQNNGTITFSLPAGWATTAVNGTTLYWIRFSYTSTPSTVPSIYNIRPGSNTSLSVLTSNGDSVATTPVFSVESTGRAMQNGAAMQPPVTFTIGLANSIGGHNADYTCPTTKAQVCIQRAITDCPTSGCHLVFLDGTFNVTDSILINKDNLSFEGQGWGATIIKMSNVPVSTFLESGASGVSPRVGTSIRNLEIDRSADTKDGVINRKCINAPYSKRGIIDHVYCHDSGATGIAMDFSQGAMITFNRIENPGTAGETTGNSCIGQGTGEYTLEPTIIMGNVCTNPGYSGILIEEQNAATAGESNEYVVVGNIVDGQAGAATQQGIVVRGTSNITISGNIVRNMGQDGLFIDDYGGANVNNVNVVGNNFNDNAAWGVQISDAGGIKIQIKNNDLSNNGSGTITTSQSSLTELTRFGNLSDISNYIPGNVGIGTTTPGTVLDVTGTSRMTGFQLTGNGVATGNVMVTNAVGLGTWMAASTLPVSGGGGSGTVSSGTADTVAIYDTAGTTVSSSSVLTDNNTNIGVGTAVPGVKLDVNGFVRSTSLTGSKCVHTDATGTLTSTAADCVSSSSSQWFTQTGTLGNVGIGTFDSVGIGTTIGNSLLTVMGGNVGIGTWNPSGLLVVGNNGVRLTTTGIDRLNGNAVTFSDTALTFSNNSSVTFSNSSSGSSANMKITGGANAASGITIQTTSSGAGTTDKVVFQGGNNGATEIARFLGTGNVGFGTTLPSATVEVKGTLQVRGASTSPWTVKSGANTACNTTCGTSMCAFGEDTIGLVAISCSDATADTCVCMGP